MYLLVRMKSKIINSKIRKLATIASSRAQDTSTDWFTSMHFEGKAEGYRTAVNRNVDEIRRLRDEAHTESLRQWSEVEDPYQYEYFCGVAAARSEVIGLHMAGG
jgi:hypothetical protein